MSYIRTDLDSFLSERGINASTGFSYSVVAVFGSQSTGKSTLIECMHYLLGTLLNGLFDTSFDVMNETTRSQTTRGIWLGVAAKDNILVLDVEGTDGRERGEDQDFERKAALFSLAVAQTVVVNIWENSVGLYNGANMGLLKTVMAVNLQLFQASGSPKTMLCFVIRDFTGRTQLSALASTIEADLRRIWSELSKVWFVCKC
jgi:protein SEY1